MPWKLTVRRLGFDKPQVHRFEDDEGLLLAQQLAWWARYMEEGDIFEIHKEGPE